MRSSRRLTLPIQVLGFVTRSKNYAQLKHTAAACIQLAFRASRAKAQAARLAPLNRRVPRILSVQIQRLEWRLYQTLREHRRSRR